jgi:uncharacterized membrane protein YccF (DUF307 family)
MLRVIGNFLWFVTGGVLMGLAWWGIGLLALLSVVGLPWARACFVLGQFAFLPFGMDAVSRRALYGVDDLGTGAAGTMGNVLWFLLAGLWLALGHVLIAFLCCLSIIGIPFGVQHLKLAGLALAPIGKKIVSKEVAAAALAGAGYAELMTLRRATRGAQ